MWYLCFNARMAFSFWLLRCILLYALYVCLQPDSSSCVCTTEFPTGRAIPGTMAATCAVAVRTRTSTCTDVTRGRFNKVKGCWGMDHHHLPAVGR